MGESVRPHPLGSGWLHEELAESAFLREWQYDAEGYVSLIRLPLYRRAEIVVDPARGFGQPIFARGGARVADVLAGGLPRIRDPA